MKSLYSKQDTGVLQNAKESVTCYKFHRLTHHSSARCGTFGSTTWKPRTLQWWNHYRLRLFIFHCRFDSLRHYLPLHTHGSWVMTTEDVTLKKTYPSGNKQQLSQCTQTLRPTRSFFFIIQKLTCFSPFVEFWYSHYMSLCLRNISQFPVVVSCNSKFSITFITIYNILRAILLVKTALPSFLRS